MSIYPRSMRVRLRWIEGWSRRIQSFNILDHLTQILGSDRTVPLFYGLTYWRTRRLHLSVFNYGFSPVSEAAAAYSDSESLQIELYRQIAETLGGEELRGRRVLEISGGLGGGFNYLIHCYGIGYGIVLDRSLHAVRAAKRRFRLNGVKADARKLPFADGLFDVILNVEASHIYFSPEFVSEVSRVLAPGGFLAMSDERGGTPDIVESNMRRDLSNYGLEVTRFRDVTDNVADACALDTARREEILAATTVPFMRNSVRQWIGVKRSARYGDFRAGRAIYFILVARRRL
jgi:SAM-dependent methyltransferase